MGRFENRDANKPAGAAGGETDLRGEACDHQGNSPSPSNTPPPPAVLLGISNDDLVAAYQSWEEGHRAYRLRWRRPENSPGGRSAERAVGVFMKPLAEIPETHALVAKWLEDRAWFEKASRTVQHLLDYHRREICLAEAFHRRLVAIQGPLGTRPAGTLPPRSSPR